MIGLLMRSVIFGLALQLLLGVSGAWAGPPTDIIKQIIEKSLDIIQNPSYGKQEKQRKVRSLVDPHFDYQEMAKRSLGPAWGSLRAGQRQEFVALFSQLLEASYADKIEKYAQRVKIDYTGEIATSPVGSEMCIRDRLPRRQAGSGR